MMQGSGPSDMNETAYGIAPFRDLAEGLALAGVASIRYDKYTFAHADIVQADAELIKNFTIEQEYITDARDALQLLRADDRIGDIYLLGHSQGAMILPRVMRELGEENFQGGVLLAGSPLPLWELQYHQNLALLSSLMPDDMAVAQAALDAEVAKLSDVQTLSDDDLKAMTFFGISAYYQKDEISYNAAQIAVALQKPLLIVQGGKDWQVTPRRRYGQLARCPGGPNVCGLYALSRHEPYALRHGGRRHWRHLGLPGGRYRITGLDPGRRILDTQRNRSPLIINAREHFMRRKDRQITNPAQMEAVLRRAQCLRLGLIDNGLAYIVPMSFGMQTEGGKLCLYFHSAPEGRKIDLIEQAGVASFEADTDIRLAPASQACEFSSAYACVMGHGTIEVLRHEKDKLHALQVLMAHYTGKTDWTMTSQSLSRVVAIKLTVETMTGKMSGEPETE